MKVLGVDGCKRGWVAVAQDDGQFREARLFSRFEALVSSYPDVEIIAVDIPIGLLDTEPRPPDREAKRLLGRRASSVFLTPPREVLEAPTYAEARARARKRHYQGVSAQAYRLREKIFEVEAVAAADRRIHEIHPEVSFRALAGRPLSWNKKSWNGVFERRSLLAGAGLVFPPELGDAGREGSDDVLDAAVASWTARRIAREEAESLPPAPRPGRTGRLIAIWY